MESRMKAIITRTPCRSEKETGYPVSLERVFCGKQSLQVTVRPISNSKSRKDKLKKFEMDNFASVEMKCEISESEKSVISKVSDKTNKVENEKSDSSAESSTEREELVSSRRKSSKKNSESESLEIKVCRLFPFFFSFFHFFLSFREGGVLFSPHDYATEIKSFHKFSKFPI